MAHHLKTEAFFFQITVKTKLGGEFITSLRWDNYINCERFTRWRWYFDYRAALLKVQYPKYLVLSSWGMYEPDIRTKEKIQNERKKIDTTTAKRMITKFTNAINHFEKEEQKTMFPNWNDPQYLKAKTKLEKYKIQLKELQK